jgi:farnesyl-diphosphate farnesyltransferase
MAFRSKQKLDSLLRDVSRSFYLTLRVLPSAIRPQISLAYLLARTSDTIADTELVLLDQRLAALESLRGRIAGENSVPPQFGEFARHQEASAERALLEKCETSLSLLGDLAVADQDLVRAVLQTIIGGQELDLRRFAGSNSANIVALKGANELDDYTYRVAGCVGEFWTQMCRAHLFASADLDMTSLLRNGVRFGKGLQLVNILRDLPRDLRMGRCYLPFDQLQTSGLSPADLLEASNEPRLRSVYDAWLDQAEAHLAAGWLYIKTLPRRSVRVRLACAWPLLLGGRTLALLRVGKVLDPARRIKVSRGEVRSMVWRSVLYYPWPKQWERLYVQTCNRH